MSPVLASTDTFAGLGKDLSINVWYKNNLRVSVGIEPVSTFSLGSQHVPKGQNMLAQHLPLTLSLSFIQYGNLSHLVSGVLLLLQFSQISWK